MKPKKPSAADRTCNMFGAPLASTIDERPVEILEKEDEKGERIPMELEADKYRAQAFQGQEWATAAFGTLEAPGNEYRVSHKGSFYYVETLGKERGATCSRYCGLMVHDCDLYALTAVLVQAVRDKQAREKREADAKSPQL